MGAPTFVGRNGTPIPGGPPYASTPIRTRMRSDAHTSFQRQSPRPDSEDYIKSAAPQSPLGTKLDNFLFASLGEDSNGLPLSVVSLFARMDLDPWQEAEILAGLPRDAASRRLASSLESLTDPQLRKTNSEATIQRLLALLPRG
jgi:hypothetical protein